MYTYVTIYKGGLGAMGGEFPRSLVPWGGNRDPEDTEKGPKEAKTIGLREREGKLENFVGLKKGESCGCVKMAPEKNPVA